MPETDDAQAAEAARLRMVHALEDMTSRYFAHQLVIELLFAALLANRPASHAAQLIAGLVEAAGRRFSPVASDDASTARMKARALFSLQAFAEMLAAGCGLPKQPSPPAPPATS